VAAALPEQATAGRLEVPDEVTALDHDGGENRWHTPYVGAWTVNSPPIDLTIAYEPVEDGWTQARIAELPAVITVGRSRDEAKALVLDALREYLLSLRSEPGDGDGEREPVALTISA
jgi:predicted RNase H-like HicB family nuclease